MNRYLPGLIAALVISARLFAQSAPGNDNLKTGQTAPTFSLPTLNQEYVTLRDFCGPKLRKPWKNEVKHVVVISFFATWCKPCIKEIPHLTKIRNDFMGLPVKFYLVDVGETREKVLDFTKKNKVDITILLDRYQKVAEKYDAKTLPRLFVLDKNGIIRKEQRGFSDGASFEEEMITLLSQLVAE